MNILTNNEILNIPEEDLPLLVLSFNYRSVISSLINIRKKSHYNHFMIYHKPGFFASQGASFTEEPVEDYLTHHRLKFWHNPEWTFIDKKRMQNQIKKWLAVGKLKSRYDWVAIIGQLIGIKSLQNPYTRICSDYADILEIADLNYDLSHPAPNDVNNWLKSYSMYQVYGRYLVD